MSPREKLKTMRMRWRTLKSLVAVGESSLLKISSQLRKAWRDALSTSRTFIKWRMTSQRWLRIKLRSRHFWRSCSALKSGLSPTSGTHSCTLLIMNTTSLGNKVSILRITLRRCSISTTRNTKRFWRRSHQRTCFKWDSRSKTSAMRTPKYISLNDVN